MDFLLATLSVYLLALIEKRDRDRSAISSEASTRSPRIDPPGPTLLEDRIDEIREKGKRVEALARHDQSVLKVRRRATRVKDVIPPWDPPDPPDSREEWIRAYWELHGRQDIAWWRRYGPAIPPSTFGVDYREVIDWLESLQTP